MSCFDVPERFMFDPITVDRMIEYAEKRDGYLMLSQEDIEGVNIEDSLRASLPKLFE